jgi:CRP-like cAMP-binding protein
VNVSDEPITLEQIISFLLDCPMFGHLDPNELSRVVHIMQVQRLRDGQYVFREGDQGDGWYVIFEGSTAVTKRQEVTPEREIAVIRSGACFGEMSILDGSPRSASVRANGTCVLFRFPRTAFDQLLREENIVAYKLVFEMSKILSARQRRLNKQLCDLIQDQQLSSSLTPAVGAIVDETTVSE